MTIAAKGFTDTVANEADWAKLMSIMARGCWDETVDNGFNPSLPTATRRVAVASGDLVAAGVLVNNSASVNVDLPANSSGSSRIDIVVLTINWSADTVSLTSVQGLAAATPVAPTLTKTAGTTWQVPIAQVLVRNGVTQIATGDMTDIRPTRRKTTTYTPSISAITIGPNASARTIATRDVPDPGWPYKLRIYACVEFTATSTGRGTISVTVAGTQVVTTRAGNSNTSAAVLATSTSTITGAATVNLTMQPFNLSSTDQLTSQPPQSYFTLVVEPA